MKKILVRSLVFVSLGCWTLFALTSGGSHPENCEREWYAALSGSGIKSLDDRFEMGTDKESPAIETHLPGALFHFLNQ